MMKVNKWTLGLAAVGLVTLPATTQADEALSPVQTALSSTVISGYVDTSAQWSVGNAKGYTTGAPPGYAFNTPSKQDGFNLNVVNLTIEKPFDAQEVWQAGYKVDMIYGPNAVGWNNSIGANSSDFAIKQAYVALHAPIGGTGLDFKLGVFDSVVGYEVYHAVNNPNYTRSYGYTFEPTQHTGLLASYHPTEVIGLAAGVADTVNAGINNRSFLAPGSTKGESDKTYMGAVTLTAPTNSMGFLGGSTLYGAVVNGFNNTVYNSSQLQDDMTWFYAGTTLNTPVKDLLVGAAYDYFSTAGSPSAVNVGKMWFDALSVYSSYKVPDTKLSVHLRAEYMWMEGGTAAKLADPTGSGTSVPTGLADRIFDLTATVQYDLWKNVLSRLEARWDHAADGSAPFNNANHNAFLVAANLIYKF